MYDPYTDRCEVLAEWLSIRKMIGKLQRSNKNMPSSHPDYASHINRLEYLRKDMTIMQQLYPWLDRVLSELGKGT